jgi:hypothetical protein
MYLTMIGAETCGMSLSGPISASCTAAGNRSVGAIDIHSGVRPSLGGRRIKRIDIVSVCTRLTGGVDGVSR